ncbi:MAG: hypothetical protein IJV72_05015 [Clostridia bacterium]|nr:hypothetical protein [Clostridia bacterium]
MKKLKFGKILSFLLVAVILSSIAVLAIPVSADTGYTEIIPNTDFVYNGITYRFDVRDGNTGSYARIMEDGSIEFKYSYGDILWFPEIKATDTSAIHAEVTAIAHDSDTSGMGYVFAGVVYGATEASDGSFSEGMGSIMRTGARTRITKITRADLTAKASDNSGYGNGGSGRVANDDITSENYNCVKNGNSDWAFGKTISFDISRSDNEVTVAFGSVDGEFYSKKYDTTSYAYAGATGFTSVWATNSQYEGYKTFKFDKLTLTNCTVEGEAKDSYTVLERQPYPMEMRKSVVEFENEYAFVDLGFTVAADYVEASSLVVKMNGTEIERIAISGLTSNNGAYSETIYFEYADNSQTTDILMFYLEKDGSAVDSTSSTVNIGELYNRYKNNPITTPGGDAYLKFAYYEEDFSDLNITLVPGENIINGHKWTYVKNSTDGSAEIKSGRLYFVGSDNDMILFDDVKLDNTPYKFVYDITYRETPKNDVWDNWDCWFGGLFHLGYEADENGDRPAIIAAVTPDSIHMMNGKVNANEGFVEDTNNSWHYEKFENTPGVYWGGRLGNGVPVSIRNYIGTDSNDSGGLYVSGYGSSHQLSATLPGDGPLSVAQRTGSVGFVCSDSRVSVMVDNIQFFTKGKAITVDGWEMKIGDDGKIDVAKFADAKNEMKLVYANVDGVFKYAGDIITANRLTQITTQQIKLATNKLTAVGQTGLKWTTQISKADYEKLMSDTNISKVEVGTVVVPTANAKNGITVATATKNIAGTATLSGDNYVFEGVLDIAKDARDTSYSGIGYIKVTMTDGKEVVVYSDYIDRQHAYALSDFVDNFVDNFVDDEPVDDNGNDDTNTPDNTTADASEEKKGCGSSVFGVGALLIVTVSLSACVLLPKKSKK